MRIRKTWPTPALPIRQPIWNPICHFKTENWQFNVVNEAENEKLRPLPVVHYTFEWVSCGSFRCASLDFIAAVVEGNPPSRVIRLWKPIDWAVGVPLLPQHFSLLPVFWRVWVSWRTPFRRKLAAESNKWFQLRFAAPTRVLILLYYAARDLGHSTPYGLGISASYSEI